MSCVQYGTNSIVAPPRLPVFREQTVHCSPTQAFSSGDMTKSKAEQCCKPPKEMSSVARGEQQQLLS